MPVGGQRLVSRAGHDEPFGGVGAGGRGVGTGSGSNGVVGNGLVVSTTGVVFGVSWQAVGWRRWQEKLLEIVGRNVEAWFKTKYGDCVGGYFEDDVLI